MRIWSRVSQVPPLGLHEGNFGLELITIFSGWNNPDEAPHMARMNNVAWDWREIFFRQLLKISMTKCAAEI